MNKLTTVRKGYKKARGLTYIPPTFISDKGNAFVNGGQPNTSLLLPWDRLASNVYGANYGDAGFTLSDYMNGTTRALGNNNWFGISKLNNPFSKGNLANMGNNLLGGLAGGAGTIVGNTIGNLIGGDLKVGGAYDTIFSGLQSFNTGIPVFDGLKNLTLGTFKGIGNKLFGSNINQEKVNEIKANTLNVLNSLFNSNSGRGFLDSYNNSDKLIGFSLSDIGHDGVFSNKAKNTYNSLRQLTNIAGAQLTANADLAANNLNRNNTLDQLANMAPYGGPIDIDPATAIGYSLYTDKYVKDNNKNNSNMNMFAGAPNSILAFGGVTQTNGASFSNGLTHVDAGGTHEESPYDGVLVGVDSLNVPNLVEEGEVIYNNQDEDYVFSNRLIVPRGKRGNYGKRNKYAKGGKLDKGLNKEEMSYEELVLKPFEGLTFADAAKKAEKLSGVNERPNDPIATRGFDSTLAVLRGSLEKEREKERLQEIQEAIDNMTPEEFMALQQLMQASQELQAQLEALAQQLQMIPQGMELMVPQEQMMAAYGGPIYLLGGILDAPENTYAYGGSFDDFTKELLTKGLTIEDYLKYLVDTGKIDLYTMDFYLTSDNNIETLKDTFNKDLAEDYINNLNTKEKEVARIYKRKGLNPDKLTGAALLKYKEDVALATKNPELLKEDTNKQLFINNVNKINPTAFNDIAKETIKNDYLKERTLNDNGKLSIRYNNEGTTPQGLSFLNDGVTYDESSNTWKDRNGNVVDNPFTKEYGFTDVARDWSRYGYINPKDNSWTDVEYNPPTDITGNGDYKYAPWNKWFIDSKMDADEYESQDAYINNYLDFLDDIYNEESPNHKAALLRLYRMGEASKSRNPEELEGKNRYFDTDKEGFDANNLSLDNLRIVDGYNTIGDENISGFSIYNKAISDKAEVSNKQYYTNKNGLVVSSTTFLELDEKEKKDWAPLDHKGLTRQDVLSHLKAIRNMDEDSEPHNLLFRSMFDNNPALSYLMAPNTTNRYVLVDNLGNYRRDANNNIRYINFDPNATYQYYDNGNPLKGQSLFINGVNVDTIGVLGGNVDNYIGVRKNPDGTWKTYELTPELAELLKQREIKSEDDRYKTLPQFEDAVGGYTFTPHYYELDDEAYKSIGLNTDSIEKPEGTEYTTEAEGFPKIPTWPYLGAGLILLGALGYNIFSPKDYSNADAMIKAALEAGRYDPIGFKPIGEYLKYNPFDINYTANLLRAADLANARNLINNSNGNTGALAGSLLANNLNNQLAMSNAYRLAFEYNDNQRKLTGEFNKDTDKFNSEGFLKADMANQSAAARAKGFTLEGLKSGYAMRQAIDDAKTNAINAGITGLGNLMLSYAQNKYNLDLLGFRMKRAIDGPGLWYKGEEPKKETIALGGKIKRRKRGLSF